LIKEQFPSRSESEKQTNAERHAHEDQRLYQLSKRLLRYPAILVSESPRFQSSSSGLSEVVVERVASACPSSTVGCHNFSFKIEEAFNGQPLLESAKRRRGADLTGRYLFVSHFLTKHQGKKNNWVFLCPDRSSGNEKQRGTTRSDEKYTESLSLRIPSGGTRE